MIKKLVIILAVYFMLLAPIPEILPFSQPYYHDGLWIEIYREDGIPYNAVEDWGDAVPSDDFEYSLYYDEITEILFGEEMIDTTLRVWREYRVYKNVEGRRAQMRNITPLIFRSNTGLLMYPPVSFATTPFHGEITVNGETILLKGDYSIDTLPISEFYRNAYHMELLDHGKSLTFLPDELMIDYYNEHHETDISSVEDLKYEKAIFCFDQANVPEEKEFKRFLKMLKKEGYEVHRPVTQKETTWRNTRIFCYTSVTIIMVAVSVFVFIRHKRKQA